MKTNLEFIDKKTNTPSRCADHFDIDISCEIIKGVLIERGRSDYFHSDQVMSTGFFFSMELEHEFDWTVEHDEKTVPVHSQVQDIWIHPANCPFSHENNNPAEFLVLTIKPEVLYKYYEGYLNKDRLRFLRDYSIQDKYIGHMMEMFLLQASQRQDIDFTKNLLRLFSNYYIKNYSNIDNIDQSVSLITDEHIKRIDDYILDHLDEQIVIEDLADLLKMNKFHFLNEFKKYMSMTPYQYLLTVRIKQAKDLLIHTDKSLVDIAFELGFSDSSHFSRTFKRYTNQSPKHYRNSNK